MDREHKPRRARRARTEELPAVAREEPSEEGVMEAVDDVSPTLAPVTRPAAVPANRRAAPMTYEYLHPGRMGGPANKET